MQHSGFLLTKRSLRVHAQWDYFPYPRNGINLIWVHLTWKVYLIRSLRGFMSLLSKEEPCVMNCKFWDSENISPSPVAWQFRPSVRRDKWPSAKQEFGFFRTGLQHQKHTCKSAWLKSHTESQLLAVSKVPKLFFSCQPKLQNVQPLQTNIQIRS